MAMSGYTKLFNSILASTVWREPNHVRIVWITLLAMSDRNGIAEGSVPGVADFARVSVDECRDALRRLSDPDRDSRSQEYEGRRIEAVDGGWRLLNHAKYRRKLSEDERREYLRVKQQEHRSALKKAQSTTVNNVSDPSTDVSDKSTPSTQAEAEAEADSDPKSKEHGAQNAPAQQRGGGLMLSPKDYARLLQHNAYVGARLRVPTKLHGDFLAALGGLDPDGRLRGWYANVDAEIEASGEAIVPDVWKWLDRRFRLWAQEQAGDAEMAKFLAGGA